MKAIFAKNYNTCRVNRRPPFRGYCIDLVLYVDYNLQRKGKRNHQISEIEFEVTVQSLKELISKFSNSANIPHQPGLLEASSFLSVHSSICFPAF